MKFLLDMGLAQSTARFLRQQGYDALHLRDQDLQRLDDAIIIAKAVAETRIILTHDLDFGRFIALGRYQVPSVITFRMSDMRACQVDLRLAKVLSRFAAELLDGAMISVTDQSIRVRQLPVQREQE